MKIDITENYPNSPPKITFLTKIFHPGVNPEDGTVCPLFYEKDWNIK